MTLDSARPDQRTLRLRDPPNATPSVSSSYSFALRYLPNDLFAPCIRRNGALPKCCSFLWEVHHHKLNTNSCLHRHGGINDGLCLFYGTEEDVPHLFLHCPIVQTFCVVVGLLSNTVDRVELLWELELPGPPAPMPLISLNSAYSYPLEHLEAKDRTGLPE